MHPLNLLCYILFFLFILKSRREQLSQAVTYQNTHFTSKHLVQSYQYLQHLMDCIKNRMFVYLIQFFHLGRTFCKRHVWCDVRATMAELVLPVFVDNEGVFSPWEEGLRSGFVSQHLTMRFIIPVSPASPAAWLLISSSDGRSPCGIRNLTMLDIASTAEGGLKRALRLERQTIRPC